VVIGGLGANVVLGGWHTDQVNLKQNVTLVKLIYGRDGPRFKGRLGIIQKKMYELKYLVKVHALWAHPGMLLGILTVVKDFTIQRLIRVVPVLLATALKLTLL